jgi:hypothetical protein
MSLEKATAGLATAQQFDGPANFRVLLYLLDKRARYSLSACSRIGVKED